MLALAVNALGIFLTWCRYTHHAAYLSIPVKVGRQHAQHAFRIEPVGLGPTGTPIDENAGWLKDMIDDTLCGQQSV